MWEQTATIVSAGGKEKWIDKEVHGDEDSLLMGCVHAFNEPYPIKDRFSPYPPL